MRIRKLVAAGAVAAIAVAAPVLSAPLAHADPTVPGSFNTIESTRILDTRKGLGAPLAAVAPGATLTFVAVPAGQTAAAVALNVTAVGPTTAGYLTVFATGTPRPLASNLNFTVGKNVPNFVITRVGTGGRVSIYNGSGGTVNVLADIHGWFSPGTNAGDSGTLVPITPTRVLDTRTGTGSPRQQIPGNAALTIKVAGQYGIPADASAVVVNLTAVSDRGHGYITAFPGGPLPRASNVNYDAYQARANLALVALNSEDGTLSLFNGAGVGVHLVADVTGYFVGGTPVVDGSFIPTTPDRLFDSRGPGGQPAGALTTSKICILTTDPTDPTCPTDPIFSIFKAVVINVTAVNPEGTGFLTTWDGIGPLPSVSNSNFTPGKNYAGSLVVPVNEDGTISIYNGSYGNVDLVVDLTGFMLNLPVLNDANRGQILTAPEAANLLKKAMSKLNRSGAPAASIPLRVTR